MNYFFKDLLIHNDIFFENNDDLFFGPLAEHNINKIHFIHVSLSDKFTRKRISNATWICYNEFEQNDALKNSIFLISVMGYKYVLHYKSSISEMKLNSDVRLSNTIKKFEAFYKQSKKFKKI